MANNELIISTANAPAKFSFKNAKLNEISAKIAEQSSAMNSLYSEAKDKAEAINRALAPLFGELLSTKCYKEDGFKSVAEYAEQTFGMGKSMAYMLARVGKDFYNADNDFTKNARDTFSTAKLAELSGCDRVAINKAIESGELSKDSSLQDCRNFATVHKRNPPKDRIVPTFTVYDMMNKSEPLAANLDKESMYEAVATDIAHIGYVDSPAEVFFSTAKLGGDKSSAAQHFIAYSARGFTRMYEYVPYVKKDSGKKVKAPDADIKSILKHFTREQIEAMLADTDDEGNQLLY